MQKTNNKLTRKVKSINQHVMFFINKNNKIYIRSKHPSHSTSQPSIHTATLPQTYKLREFSLHSYLKTNLLKLPSIHIYLNIKEPQTITNKNENNKLYI